MPVVEDVLWKNPGNPGMIVITSHASVLPDGRLDIRYGEGIEAVKRIPGIDLQCGQTIQKLAVDGLYGFVPVRTPRPSDKIVGFGIFQTRLAPNETANPAIIKYSMDCLRQFVDQNSDVRIRMNFPGLSSGLAAEDVAPLLIPLPGSITVCHKGELERTMPQDFVGFKAIYVQVERMLQEGRMNNAVEYLVANGFDIQSAMDQVRAVDRLLRERSENDSVRFLQRRENSYQTRFNL